jgi:hypothetical protein
LFRLQAIGRTTEWHESHDRFEAARRFAKEERKIEREIVNANIDLKKMRHERLKELYIRENQEFEAQLNDLGLAILKDRL